ncbi:MAG: YkgJ family cysteine cluster protein, partial [Planctomycetota bacterium]
MTRDGRTSASAASATAWYGAGLRFRCTACGACCTGAPGNVWVEAEEIDAMAEARGLTRRQFRRRYVRRAGRRLSLKERKNGDCVMLEGTRCTVYDAKPLRCSTFPFWPEILDSPGEWEETAGRCEGIGQGDLYSRAEIEYVASGDPRPLLAKQAAAHPDGAAPGPAPGGEPDWEAAFRDLEVLYAQLDRELPRYRFTCSASGRC